MRLRAILLCFLVIPIGGTCEKFDSRNAEFPGAFIYDLNLKDLREIRREYSSDAFYFNGFDPRGDLALMLEFSRGQSDALWVAEQRGAIYDSEQRPERYWRTITANGLIEDPAADVRVVSTGDHFEIHGDFRTGISIQGRNDIRDFRLTVEPGRELRTVQKGLAKYRLGFARAELYIPDAGRRLNGILFREYYYLPGVNPIALRDHQMWDDSGLMILHTRPAGAVLLMNAHKSELLQPLTGADNVWLIDERLRAFEAGANWDILEEMRSEERDLTWPVRLRGGFEFNNQKCLIRPEELYHVYLDSLARYDSVLATLRATMECEKRDYNMSGMARWRGRPFPLVETD
ncbi:MAG: hypothetical protein KDK27_16165 [Leptospiraceae bacterium]|nr:hypothetical protein [Leptospiraceae bacterium]